jgi:hypothetical protein
MASINSMNLIVTEDNKAMDFVYEKYNLSPLI